MRVLIACEFSGVVRRAFRQRGHDAWSCDLRPAEDDSPNHYQCDIFRLLERFPNWDLMIGHPECTYLCNSGVRWLYQGGNKRKPIDFVRWQSMLAGAEFFRRLWDTPIPRVALENPVMHAYARATVGMPFTQSVQPWQFGDPYKKRTCLWLRGLPSLVPTSIVPQSERIAAVHHEPPGPNRQRNRSRTYPGIAAAMAEQWGSRP